jgi:hypothetical protein
MVLYPRRWPASPHTQNHTIPGLKYHIKEADRLMKKPKEKLNISRKVNTGSIQLKPPTTKPYWKWTMANNSRK